MKKHGKTASRPDRAAAITMAVAAVWCGAAGAGMGAGCVSVGGRLGQSLVTGSAAEPEPVGEFEDPPPAQEGDDVSDSSTIFIVDMTMGFAHFLHVTVGYGMAFPTVRIRNHGAQAAVSEGENEFADRLTLGASVPVVVLGGSGGRAAAWQLRAYGEAGMALITKGEFAAPGPTFNLDAGIMMRSDRGFVLQAGLTWEKGTLGGNTNDYSAKGVTFAAGYQFGWPGGEDR